MSSFVLIESGSQPERRIGIYALGACDLRVILGCAPLITPVLTRGTCCLCYEDGLSETRSDLLLQTLRPLPPQQLEPILKNLSLRDDFFRPRLFTKTFAVPKADGPLPFDKNVVVISVAADVVRTIYRHREHGILVDPGGFWLNRSMEVVLKDLSVLNWFRDHFQSIGTMDLANFVANFTAIIRRLKDHLGAHVLVFNSLTVDPGSLIHNYQFVKNSHAKRRREFNLALVELSRQLDFSIVDVDRAVKRVGIRTQLDFGHPPPAVEPFIALEVVRVLRELQVF